MTDHSAQHFVLLLIIVVNAYQVVCFGFYFTRYEGLDGPFRQEKEIGKPRV